MVGSILTRPLNNFATSMAFVTKLHVPGIAERKNRQLLEIVLASLFDMNIPREYWGEVVRSAAYLTNRTPSRVLGFKTPFQKLQELVPSLSLNNLEP